MSAPRGSGASGERVDWAFYPAGFTDCLGERGEIVDRGFRLSELTLVTDDVPAPRSGQPQRVPLAQVVGVRLAVGGQRAHHRSGIGVHESERGNRRVNAPGSRTPPRAVHDL